MATSTVAALVSAGCGCEAMTAWVMSIARIGVAARLALRAAVSAIDVPACQECQRRMTGEFRLEFPPSRESHRYVGHERLRLRLRDQLPRWIDVKPKPGAQQKQKCHRDKGQVVVGVAIHQKPEHQRRCQ